jgi:uncharacterized protein
VTCGPVKFITDSNLGKLAKWMRILGYDTTCFSGNAGRSFLNKARNEGRIALTRKKDMAQRQFSGKLILIQHDLVRDQLREVINQLSLMPESGQFFTLCLKCNEQLKKVSRDEVSGMVPDYIYMCHTEFHLCPRCRGIFWPGTHRHNVDRFLKMHIQHHHP